MSEASKPYFAREGVELYLGDCLNVLKGLESNSVDAICCDPPAGINFMNKSFDSDRGGRDRWIDWLEERMREALRVAKPGAHAFVWALPRTSHWTAMALEDAGWQIREVCYHVFATGFPKSKNLGGGWGSALKPAVENWILCRAPLSEKSIEANFTKHGTGALNIDESRIGTGAGGAREGEATKDKRYAEAGATNFAPKPGPRGGAATGRWPSNFLMSHSPECERVGTKRVKKEGGATGVAKSDTCGYGDSWPDRPVFDYADQSGYETQEDWICQPQCPIRILDEQSGVRKSGRLGPGHTDRGKEAGTYGAYGGRKIDKEFGGDQGGASRFFACFSGEPDTGKDIYAQNKSRDRKNDKGTPKATQERELEENEGRRLPRHDDSHHNDNCSTRDNSPGAGGVSVEPDTGSGFRYVPKSSRAERNRGLGGMPQKRGYEQDGQPFLGCSEGGSLPHQTPRKHTPQANYHPTVKPLTLIKYLVKMITPPGGTVLDCFLGSGTTGVAAVEEGFNFVGIEQDESYMTIAMKRIEYHANVPASQREKAKPVARLPRRTQEREDDAPQGRLFA